MSLQEFLPTPEFDEYKEFFKDFFTMERRDDGVLLARHTPAADRSSSVCRTTVPSVSSSRRSGPTPRTSC